MDSYNVFMADVREANDAAQTLSKICKMKYEGADRAELYAAGFTQADIERSSTVVLATEYLGILKYVAFQSAAHRSKAVKSDTQGAATSPAGDYPAVPVRDFVAKGAALADKGAKVTLTGSYLLQGDRGLLYPDTQAIVMTQYHPEAGPQPNIPLVINGASPQLLRRFHVCQTDLSAAKVGCTVKIRGAAMMCPATDTTGATHEVPCLNAEDGK
jgi:hypothetical protein